LGAQSNFKLVREQEKKRGGIDSGHSKRPGKATQISQEEDYAGEKDYPRPKEGRNDTEERVLAEE